MNEFSTQSKQVDPNQDEPSTLGEMLTPVSLGDDRFRIRNVSTGWPRLFGGQVAAQTLAAAGATVGEDRLLNSFHAYFLRGGVRGTPIECTVERERDGGSFSNRRVVASQAGKSILSLIASYHTGEKGPERETLEMPEAGNPEDYPSYQEIPVEAAALDAGKTPVEVMEVRPVVGGRMAPDGSGNMPGKSVLWMRFRDTRDADQAMARLMIAYASDFMLMGTALMPHREDVGARPVVASIDHAVRFHAPPDVSDWMLCVQSSDWAGEGRSLIRAVLFGRDGKRIASISQEGLLRL